MFALVQSGTITQVGALPRLYHDGTRWWDYRDGQHDPALQGWLPVVRTPRPADTATHTHVYAVEILDGTPIETWTAREWTAGEIAARQEQAARLDSIEDRLAVLWAAVFPPDPEPADPVPQDFPEFDRLWHPGTIISEGGRLWRNTTTVPLTSAPSEFPGDPSQWTHLFVEVTTTPDPDPDPTYPQWRGEWSADAEYVIGDHVTRDGIIYRCLVAHGAEHAGTWGPPATGVWVAA